MKTNIEYMINHDSFSKLLEQELFNLSIKDPKKENSNQILADLVSEKADTKVLATNFLEESLEVKIGLSPLVKKFKLIEYVLKHKKEEYFTQQIPSLTEVKKAPPKDLLII
jgi:hypothetical protein